MIMRLMPTASKKLSYLLNNQKIGSPINAWVLRLITQPLMSGEVVFSFLKKPSHH